MKNLFIVMKFTIKEMIRKKSFIISTLLIIALIIVGFCVPKIIKSIQGEDKKDKGAKDYTKFESNNLKVLKTYSDFNFVKKGYDIMQINNRI